MLNCPSCVVTWIQCLLTLRSPSDLAFQGVQSSVSESQHVWVLRYAFGLAPLLGNRFRNLSADVLGCLGLNC
jgi:hypothetical protein